jgi:hypothetical protein
MAEAARVTGASRISELREGEPTMSETKHTPGPWKVCQLGGEKGWHVYFELGRGTAPGFSCTADLFAKAIATAADYGDEARANARLIAAAPDLLAAAKVIASFAVSWEPLTPGDIRQLTDAIAKAEASR